MSENLQVQNQNNKINFKKLQKKLRKNLPVYQETDSYNFRYQEFADRTDEQIKNNHWTWKEIDVAKDKQDFLVEMTEAEKFATSFVLKLFLKYEISIGAEWWADKFMKMFKRPEFQRKAIFNSSQELNIHAPFYNELNKQLGLTSDEFYESYLKDEELVKRVKFIGEMLNHELDLISLATFTFLEGAVLYSSFAFFKHFQMNGKNMLGNVVRGTDMSVLDENNHSIDSSDAYKIIVEEGFEKNILTEQNYLIIVQIIHKLSDVIFEHESLIIDKIFSKGNIEGITKSQLKNFMLLRLNECLVRFGLQPKYHIADKTIYNWFKNTTELYASNDTFQGKGREYISLFDKSKIRYLEELN